MDPAETNPDVRKIGQRKAKTHKGRRHLDKYKPKLREGDRQCIIIKGNKTSDSVTKTMQYFYDVRRNHNIKLQRRNEIKPFEDASNLEFLAVKNMSPLFIFGSNTKKKPNSLILGRVFNGKVLDMVDFEIVYFEEINEGKSWNKILFDNFPCVTFQGAGFEFDNDNKRIRNLLHDLFSRSTEVKEGDLLGLTRMYISVVLHENVISLRFYISKIVTSMMENNAWANQDVLEEIGPRIDLRSRRKQISLDDEYKLAISQKSYLTQKAKKNIELTNMGDKIGRLHVQQPDLKTLEIRKFRRFVEKGKRQLEKEKRAAAAKDEANNEVADHEKPQKKIKTD